MTAARRFAALGLLSGIASLAIAGPARAATPVHPPQQQEYWARFAQHDWSAAIGSAEELVNAARAAAQEPLPLADALILLGNAQLGAKNLPAAEAAYREALTIIEPRTGAGNEKLLEPLRGLGYALAAGGRHAEAIPLLQRALVIARRNFGLFDLSQQGLLRQLATSFTSVNDAAEAQKHMLYMLQTGERAYGKRDLRMVPLYCAVGDWYAQIGVMPQARDSYREALSIAEQKAGRNHPDVVDPLRSIANSYRRELFLSGAGLLRTPEADPDADARPDLDYRPITAQFLHAEGERALLRAVQIVDANAAANSGDIEQLTIDTLIDAGDWYQIRSQSQKAFEFYRRAAARLPPVAADSAAAATRPFGFPVQIHVPTPQLAIRNRFRPPNELVERFVRVEFTVASDGSVKDEHVVEQDAGARPAAETLSAIRAARYRPKFANGEPVATTAVSYRQIFRQRKDRDAEPEKDRES